MAAFVESRKNPNFKFWWSYIQMVQILLLFTRAQRDGLWQLHLHSFTSMLPYFFRYNHVNYARWGTVYISEMHKLPAEVEAEFEQGNFVVKRSERLFNQVSPDQSQEWLNGIGKKGGGIVGITKTTSALSRWALSYNLRSHLGSETKSVYGIGRDDTFTHNENKLSRQKVDLEDEDKIFNKLQSLHLFSDDSEPELHNIVTKDIMPQKITNDLLSARQKGHDQLLQFVQERLVADEHSKRKVAFSDPLARNKYLTFSSLFEVEEKQSKTSKRVVCADRKFLQRILTASQARRQVNLEEILQYELLPTPPCLADMMGNL